MVTDLFAIFALVGALTEHAFISYHTRGEVVNRDSVRLAAHYFRCHVAGSARRVFSIIWVPNASNTKVSDSEVTMLVKDKVFWLDISV